MDHFCQCPDHYYFVLILPGELEKTIIKAHENYERPYQKAWLISGVAVLVSSFLFTGINRLMYHYPAAERIELLKDKQTRFGTEATWRSRPNLKNARGQ